jgi:hypothetical protein
VGLGELVHPRPAEFAADAAGVEPAERRALVDRGGVVLLKNWWPPWCWAICGAGAAYAARS